MFGEFKIQCCDWTKIDSEHNYAIAINGSVVFTDDDQAKIVKAYRAMVASYNGGIDVARYHSEAAMRNSIKKSMLFDEPTFYHAIRPDIPGCHVCENTGRVEAKDPAELKDGEEMTYTPCEDCPRGKESK